MNMDILSLFIIICVIKLHSSLEFKLQRGKYMDSQVIEVKVNYGPSMCVRACIRYRGCYGVNYKRDKLLCELIEEQGIENQIEDDDSFSCSRKSDWKIEHSKCSPNPCPAGKKCVVTHNGLVVCVAINTETTFLEKPKECSELSKRIKSGIYTIYPNKSNGTKVYCDMDTDGGSWTVFQKRTDASIDFQRGWDEYESGFGDVESNYWIGNANLNILTQQQKYQLRVDLEDWDGDNRYALYNTFSIGDSASKYTLTVGNYSGNAGNNKNDNFPRTLRNTLNDLGLIYCDSLSVHNNMKFTTKDNDNDLISSNCADRRKGAWWYKSCAHSNLNGIYQHGVQNKHSLSWKTFRTKLYSLKSSRMMIRKFEM